MGLSTLGVELNIENPTEPSQRVKKKVKNTVEISTLDAERSVNNLSEGRNKASLVLILHDYIV